MTRRGAELDIVCHVAAMRELLDVHWRRGEVIDCAILRFAKEGVGNLRRIRSAPGRLGHPARAEAAEPSPKKQTGRRARDDAPSRRRVEPSTAVRGAVAEVLE